MFCLNTVMTPKSTCMSRPSVSDSYVQQPSRSTQTWLNCRHLKANKSAEFLLACTHILLIVIGAVHAPHKHWQNTREYPKIELIISRSSTIKPTSPIPLISDNDISIHLLILIRSFEVFLDFLNFSGFHITLTRSIWINLECKATEALYPVHLRNMFAASNFAGLALPSGQREASSPP